jgi:hypothetical protein
MPLHPIRLLLPALAIAAAAPGLGAQTGTPAPDSARTVRPLAPPSVDSLAAFPSAPVVDSLAADPLASPILTVPAIETDSATADSARAKPATGSSATADSAVAASIRAARGTRAWDAGSPAGRVRALRTIGGAGEEEARVAQLRGQAAGYGYLLRAPSTETPWDPGARGFRLSMLAPEVLLAWNTEIPVSINDGALWAGRGGSTLAMAGFETQAGPVRLIVAPEVAYASNAAFDTLIPLAWRQADPETFYADWQVAQHSIDLPYRMGTGEMVQLRPGQSSLTVSAGPLAFGAATENQWWGPGIRNALLLSNGAPGFGHLFLRTARPLATPVGRVEARWIAGALRDSEWFAAAHGGGERGWRSFSAAALVLSPSPTLSLGIARSVMARADGFGGALGGGADVLTRWEGAADSASADPFEQVTSLWGRLVLPREGAEVYLEWARTRLPSVRGLLETPEHSQGYTLGLQWLPPQLGGDVRIQAEHTYAEESPTYAWRENGSWYASAAVPQGYTNEGQLLGASVGPGGSGQWLAVDWLRGRGRGGVFLGRYRWNEDARYDKEGGAELYLDHDASLYGGLRAAFALGPVRLDAEWTLERRWNYLFQSDATDFNNRDLATHVWNNGFRLRLSALP